MSWHFPPVTIRGSINFNWTTNHWWKIIFGVLLTPPYVFLSTELNKESSDFCTILICTLFFSLFVALLLKVFGINWQFGDWWKFPLLTIIGLMISLGSDVITKSDGNWANILKRIYSKENTVDLSAAIKNIKRPHITVVLDMSGSTTSTYQNGKAFPAKKKLTEQVKKILAKSGIADSDINAFINDVKNKNTEYSMYKLRLFDFIAQTEDRYDLNLICFSEYPYSSGNWERGRQVRRAFDYIRDCEKHKESRKNTDFVELFKEIDKKYTLLCEDENKRQENRNTHKSPQFSIAFFSDYIDDNNNSEIEINKVISEFFKKPYYVNIYYCNEKGDYTGYSGEGINVFNIIENNIIKYSAGRLLPITNGEVNLFNISSKQYIPVYYEYAYDIDKESKTKITFKDITVREIKSTVSLKSNHENEINSHHQFKINNKILPLDIAVDNTADMTLTFSGRVTEQYPCHSLVFYFEESNGYCKFDIIFFKDFPMYVRYVITLLIIFIMSSVWNVFIRLSKFIFKKYIP